MPQHSKHAEAAAHQFKQATLEFQVRCGAFFRQRRLQANKTEREVAGYLDIPVHALQRYESGEEGIPLQEVYALSLCLRIPSEKIMELHLDLEKQLMPQPLFDQGYLCGRNEGEIIRLARETVFLTANHVAQLLRQDGYDVSESDIVRFENNESEPSSNFWVDFCRLLHADLGTCSGYSRWRHLALLNVAMREKRIRFPVGPEILQALEDFRAACDTNYHRAQYLLNFSMSWSRKRC